MKRSVLFFASALPVIILSVGLISCTSLQSTTTTTLVSSATSASSAALCAAQGVQVDNVALGALAVSGLVAKGAQSTPTFGSDGWISFIDTQTFSVWSISHDINTKITSYDGTVIDTAAKLAGLTLSDVNRMDIYATLTITATGGASTTVTAGSSKSSPLVMTGVGSPGAGSISGTLTFSGSSDSTAYTVTITYSSLTIASSGYPSGSATFSVASGGSALYAGTITFDGDSTATLTFTSGTSGTYIIYLNTGLAIST